MSKAKELLERFELGTEVNEADIDSVIKAVVDAKPSSDNADQGKFVQLLRGLAFSDDPKATAFMSKVMGAIDNSFIKESVVEEITDNGKKRLESFKKASKLIDKYSDYGSAVYQVMVIKREMGPDELKDKSVIKTIKTITEIQSELDSNVKQIKSKTNANTGNYVT